MKSTLMSLAALGIVALLAVVPQALAQAPGAQQQPPAAQEEQLFEGTLVNVDAEEMIVTARSEDGETMQFTYNADTEVSGGTDSVQGLSDQSGAAARITYQAPELPDEAPTATRIEVTNP